MSKKEELINHWDGQRHAMLDAAADIQQEYDDFLDGCRDNYLDSLDDE